MPRVGSTVLRFLTLVFVASLMSPVPAVAQSPDGQCNTVGGLHSVSSTLDQGASYAATPRPLEAGTGTFGIAPLQTEGGFVASHLLREKCECRTGQGGRGTGAGR